ncbi:hypothetical protein [Bdellovibrio sp. HCB337]|uniref:hypothetical protein n=1 Tax=Bdellovibrio sp. HCB337 TaxID=3394358 RepID=UPI0039A5284E
MKFVFATLTLAVTLVHSSRSHAQLDSSYELLLGTHAASVGTETSAPTKMPTTKKKRLPASDVPTTNVQVPVSAKTEIPQGPPMPAKLDPDVQLTPKTPEAPEPSISQQAQSLFTADPEKVIGFYENQFDDEDPRQNKVDISFAPGFANNESSSNYSFRDYRSVYTAITMGANVWLTPAIGVGGNFLFSLGADTSGDAVTNTRSPARYEFLDLGLKFRQFFGFTPLSKSLEFDVLYSDYKMNVNADDLQRAKLKSSGAGLKVILRLPTSKDMAWYLGGSFYPRLQHSESKAGVEVNSGNNTENVRLGVQLGSEIKLSRQSQIFYEGSVMSEKNLFDGTAGVADPATGATPTNVSVTNTMYLFSIGYRWGN